MTNNDTRDQIIALFPDNFDNEISAQDMRTYINAIFDTKEELTVKIATATDISLYNANIYEGSMVIIFNDAENTGIYLSTVNQPTNISELIKL